jgi:predicted TPR repeat methyltransferase
VLLHEAQQALAQHPDDGHAHYLFGRITRDRTAKLAAFETAVRLAPDSVWPWLGLAHTLRSTDRDRALRIYERVQAASSGHPLVAIAYAATLREAGRLDDAARVYTQLQRVPEQAGVAALGLAQVALGKADRSASWRNLLLALAARPFDVGVQSMLAGVVEAGLPDDQVQQVLDVLRADPQAFATVAAGDGLGLLVPLLQRDGQVQALRSALVAARVDARRPVLRRLQRRLELMVGEVWSFLGMLQADIPRELVAAEPNQVRGRWLALLDGPWLQIDPAAPTQRSWNRSIAADLVAALRDVGLLREAELLAASALHTFGADARCRELLDEVRAELAFESGLRRVLYQGYQDRDGADLDVVLQRLRELSQRVFGRDVVGAPPRFTAPLVGEMCDPFQGPLAEHLARYNKHLVLGRRSGGTAEGLLLVRLSLTDLPDSRQLALPARCFEVVGCDRDVKSLGGVLGGDLAGVALLNHFLIDHDAVREWAAGIADRRRIAAEDGMALTRDPLPAVVGDDPMDAAWRLVLLSPVQDTTLDAAVLDTIRHHERQHLVDAFYYLPVEQNLWRSLGLLFSFAFSPAAIEAEMERRAELASLAVSPHTELVLAHIADFMQDPGLDSPHHRGFQALGRELVAELQALGVAAADSVPSRWHTVPMATVRAAAQRLLGQVP